MIDSVTVEPGWARWSEALTTDRVKRGNPADRASLGIADDRGVVMSGHQSIVFHPGIVAKLAAMMHAAERTGASPVWLIPDMDVIDPTILRVPTNNAGIWGVNECTLTRDPIGAQLGMAHDAIDGFADVLPDELGALVDRLNAYSFEDSISRQFGAAVVDLACEWLGVDTPLIVFASDLHRTAGFTRLIDAMIEDPRGCVDAYNRAAGMFPDAEVRALEVSDDRVELPLWHCPQGGTRRRVMSNDLGSIQRSEIVPRGLTMTAIARDGLCDLFIHGTGGWGYDRVTEEWMRSWLGVDLNPMALVSATQRLAFSSTDPIEDPARAIWNAHHALHDPGMVGDDATRSKKMEMVQRIRSMKHEGHDPSRVYAELQSLLGGYREERGDEIAAMRQRAADALGQWSSRSVLMDRTWAFVLFDEESGVALMDRVRAQMR